MTVVIPFHEGDARLALDLLNWIKELDGIQDYRCLLVFPQRLLKYSRRMLAAASGAFTDVRSLQPNNPPANESWPRGANWMFEQSARYIQRVTRQPFLWLEPDAVPLRRGWLTMIERAYEEANKPFMGSVIDLQGNKRGIAGVAVYPHDAAQWLAPWLRNRAIPWDIASGNAVWPAAHVTPLIYHFWGSKEMPPTFRAKRHPSNPSNTLLLENLPKETVLYHRCKDGSLTRLLRTML